MALKLQGIVDSLWHALSHDKRPLAVLLGAGCPASVPAEDGQPLIPTIAGLTKTAGEALQASSWQQQYDTLRAMLEADKGSEPNIEELLTQLRGLQEVAGQEKVRGLSVSDMHELEKELTQCIADCVSVELPVGATPYSDLARWAVGTARESPLQLFTTNYDLLLEQALERARVPFFDGFVGGHEPFLDIQAIEGDALPSRWVRVWKLHGSVHWSQEEGHVRRRRVEAAADMPMIHPSHLKYEQSRRMPYLVMQDRLRSFLRQPSATLVTCGYSFSDGHLNELITQGLAGNASAVTFALLFDEHSAYKDAFELAIEHRNLIAMARDGGCVSGLRSPPDSGPAVMGVRSVTMWPRRTDRDEATQAHPRADRAKAA